MTITVDDDLGDKLGAGHLSIDDTAMSMFLRDLIGNECDLSAKKDSDRKEVKKKGLFLDFASRVLENKFSSISSGINGSPSHIGGLNAAQAGFVGQALNHDISILWGPPVLENTDSYCSNLELVDLGEKTLIC